MGPFLLCIVVTDLIKYRFHINRTQVFYLLKQHILLFFWKKFFSAALLKWGSRKKQVIYLSSSNSLKCSLITLTQWLRKLGLNDLGNLFNTAASLTRLRKQFASVAAPNSKANTAFLNGSNMNVTIHMSEKNFAIEWFE